jgi:hypothetical protein
VTDSNAGVREEPLAREVFGPLGGFLGLCVLHDSGKSQPVQKISVEAFTAAHEDAITRLMVLVQQVGSFQPATMEIFDQLGWNKDHDVSAFLPMWSEWIESYPPDLGDPSVVRRMIETASDLQLTRFLHALVSASLVRSDSAESSAALIGEALRLAGDLWGDDPGHVAWSVFRMWRVHSLLPILRPGVGVPANAQDRWREYARALELNIRP